MTMFMEYNRLRQRRVLLYYLCAGLTMAMARKKTIWSVERSSVWWEDVVLETYNDQQWLENFRMPGDEELLRIFAENSSRI